MDKPFDYFIILAEMRTGSNFLETNINAFDGLTCHGEAFNPHFIGYPNKTELLGQTQPMREKDPLRLLALLKAEPGLNGFRFFHDHDARVLDFCLNDARCAKIVLSRNPAESYVSWKIAKETGQWKLTNVKKRKAARAHFDAEEFARHLDALQQFQITLLNRLQTTGQTAFYLDYEDLQNIDVMNGLAGFLGCDSRLEALDKTLKRQNPGPLADKVENFQQMQDSIARIDTFNLSRTPNFSPRRGAGVPGYLAAPTAPLLYMPMSSGPNDAVERWLAGLDNAPIDALQGGFNQKKLRQWKRAHPGHRSFTVLRHPVARAHAGFCHRILNKGPGGFHEIRRGLRDVYSVTIPEDANDPSYDVAAHRAAFLGFIAFLKENLAGRTSLRQDPAWSLQSNLLQGMGQFAFPDVIVREDEMDGHLPALAEQIGYSGTTAPVRSAPDTPFELAEIYTADIEKAVSDVYQRDYMMFGFSQWRGKD